MSTSSSMCTKPLLDRSARAILSVSRGCVHASRLTPCVAGTRPDAWTCYAGQEKASRRPSRERLKKTDDRLDHLVACEQLVVVVIGVGKDTERLRSHRRLVQPPTIVDRHDSI